MNDLSAHNWLFTRAEERHPLVWLLLGTRRGDRNQLFALAEELGFPFEAKPLTYNWFRHVSFVRGMGLLILSRESRGLIQPPWPDLVITIGYAGVWVGRHIRRRSGGRTKLVEIGNPRTTVDDLDLVITTPQYTRAPAPNVLALPLPMGNPIRKVTANAEEEHWLRAYPRPRCLVAVGGPARHWKLDHRELDAAIAKLVEQAAREGGSLIVVTSPRTTPATQARLGRRLAGTRAALVGDFPRFPVLLAGADEIHVTADSVSMLSEAALTGKPVGMIPIDRSVRGHLSHWLHRLGGRKRPVPDLPRFWRLLAQEGLAGRVDSPMASTAEDSVRPAARAVRRLLREAPNPG